MGDGIRKRRKLLSIIITTVLFGTAFMLNYTPTVQAGVGDAVLGEIGIVSIGQMQWYNISFNQTFDSIPVVIASPSSNNRGSGNTTTSCSNCADGGGCNDDACDGILPVINWIGTTGFNCTIMYDNGTSAVPPVGSEPGVTDDLCWWAINTSAISSYDWIDAGVETSVSSGLTGDNTQSISFSKTLSGTPAVFVCAQTYSQAGNLPAYYWVASTATTTAFDLQGGVHYATDDCNAGLGHENVGWLAIDLDECLIEGFEYGSAVISNSAWTDFSHTATDPRVIVMQNSDAGSQDPEYCQARKIFSADPEFRYNEQDGDGVSNSHNGETVYWAVLDNQTDNGNITAPNPIATSVDTITPYDTNTNPLTITATSSGGSVSNVTLWYRYSSDNTSWGTNYEATINDLTPDYWWKLDGDETDSADGLDSDGGSDPSWVSPIVTGSSATYCGDYDGTTATTHLPNAGDINDGTTYDRCVSVWFNADTIDTTGNGRLIWEEGGGTNWASLYVHEESGEDRIYWTMGEGGSGGVVDYLVYGPISEGVTYHVGIWVDYSAQDMYMYINGTQVDSNTGPFNTGTSLSSHTSNPAIGGDDGSPRGWDMGSVSGHFDGRIQDFIYWGDEHTLLSASDFQDIYDAGISTGIPWIEWSDASNPDTTSPWSWDFNFPNSTGYYQFHSIGKNAVETESVPGEADAFCNYTYLSMQWNTSEPIAWYVENITDVIILNLTTSGNMSIAGTLYESSSAPANVAFTMNNVLWLTTSGDLHIAGTITTVTTPAWKIENVTNVEILKMSSGGNLEITGSLFENI